MEYRQKGNPNIPIQTNHPEPTNKMDNVCMINNLNNINNMNNKPACDTCMNTTMDPIKPKKNRITINISSLSTKSSDDSSEAIVPPVSTQSHTICCGECECLPEEKIGYYYRNRERKLEYQKKYNKEQGDKIKNYNKDYYQKRREEILEKAKTKIICECGCEVQLFNMNSHKKTKKHLRALQAKTTIGSV